MKNGILLINKPEGFTSTDVDRKIGKLLNTRKVGHLGTLDPFATGLLIVAVNKGTKYLPFIPDDKKTYIASLKLGYKSSTGDLTGDLTETSVPESLDADFISNVLQSFKGKQTQIPPMTSSIKVNGKPLYKLAHKGIEIERKPRDIEVFNISFLRFENNTIDFSCTVSKGTYIRTLGEDIALKLGSNGYLLSLKRVSIGNWLIGQAKDLENISENDVLFPEMFVSGMPHYNISDDVFMKVNNGVAISLDNIKDHYVLLMHKNIPLAIYKYNKEDNLYHCERGLQ